MTVKRYEEYTDGDGMLPFKIVWCDELEPDPIDVSVIDHSNFHLFRYMAIRDYLIDQLDEHGGMFVGCSKQELLDELT